MEPKEKAIELVEKYHYQICNDNGISENGSTELCAKQCALIAVDEILDENMIMDNYKLDSTIMLIQRFEFWNQVKSEIEKL